MVSLPLHHAPARGFIGRVSAVFDFCRDFLAMVGAAGRVAAAVEAHRRPHAEDLRLLGIREIPQFS